MLALSVSAVPWIKTPSLPKPKNIYRRVWSDESVETFRVRDEHRLSGHPAGDLIAV